MEVAEELEEGDNHTTINLHQNKCREMLAGGWGAGGRSGIHYGWGGFCTIPNIKLFVGSGWNKQ